MRTLYWNALSPADRAEVLMRPAHREATQVAAEVQRIIARVRGEGDGALKAYTAKLDGVALEHLEVSEEEFHTAALALNDTQHAALERAITTVRTFHAAQVSPPIRVETAPGVICERFDVPIEAVGLYVPAGTAPLPSTAIMLAVPAALAGCPVQILCTPPRRDGSANPAVLTAARKAGIERIYKVGGAQAIAAMAYGTDSIAKCDKIFGPGNAWVTAAKLAVASDPAGAAADLPAGVTEVMVIADSEADPRYVAADLLAQAEHSVDAQALLVTSSAELAEATAMEIRKQQAALSRHEILMESVASIRLLLVEDLDVAFDVANRYAPEHLIVQVRDARRWLPRIRRAGAVFLGPWSPESMGDYCSGPNHTLPTYGYARAYSGLSVEDFQRRMTVQELSRAGLEALSPTAETLAELEGLDGHAAAVRIRRQAQE